MLKITELFVTRKKQIFYLRASMLQKEKIYVRDLKAKSFLELITMIFIYYSLFGMYFYAECQSIYFSIGYFIMMSSLFYYGMKYYLRYENLKEDFRTLDRSLCDKVSKKENCPICSEVLSDARILKCGHVFHLICMREWIAKGNRKCPICHKEIKGNEKIDRIFETENKKNIKLVFSPNAILFWHVPNIVITIKKIGGEDDDNSLDNISVSETDSIT